MLTLYTSNMSAPCLQSNMNVSKDTNAGNIHPVEIAVWFKVVIRKYNKQHPLSVVPSKANHILALLYLG